MPRFSANLGLLWPDRPLPQRIEAAARAGFRAIEMHFPYDVPATEVAAAARRNDLALLGINTFPGYFPRDLLDSEALIDARRLSSIPTCCALARSSFVITSRSASATCLKDSAWRSSCVWA